LTTQTTGRERKKYNILGEGFKRVLFSFKTSLGDINPESIRETKISFLFNFE
jgi:hypothetical protein